MATEEQIKPNNTSIDFNRLPIPSSNEVSGGNEPGYYMVAPDDIEPAPDRGLTECLARMSLSPSTTTLISELFTTKKKGIHQRQRLLLLLLLFLQPIVKIH